MLYFVMILYFVIFLIYTNYHLFMKFITAPVKSAIVIFVSSFLSYYMLMARQTLHLSQVIGSFQFWLMFALGALFFYCYFRYSEYLNRRIPHSIHNSILIFLIVRLLLGVWLPSILILFFLKQLFSLWELDFRDSGYLNTEYFILMIILYCTTIGFIASYFYNGYQRVQRNTHVISTRSHQHGEISIGSSESNPILNANKEVDLDRQIILKRELADMLLHVVIIRKRKNNILLFRDDGTCELFISDPEIIDRFIQEETVMQINRWIWVNAFYIKDVKRVNNEDLIIIDEILESKFRECKSFYEPIAQNQPEDKSNLFIGRVYKKEVKLWLKNNRGNIGA